MLNLLFREDRLRTVRILCLGAHADDIEIGCGGAILTFLRRVERVEIDWIVLSGQGHRSAEARRSAASFMAGAHRSQVEMQDFDDAYFPQQARQIKDYFESLKRRLDPDLIFTHHTGDLHQDHRLVAELTWNTFRDHFILEYEVIKYDGDLGRPNVYVPLDDDLRERKVSLLMAEFPTQAERPWFSPETFDAVMRLRGVECRAPGGMAEAFHCRKVCL